LFTCFGGYAKMESGEGMKEAYSSYEHRRRIDNGNKKG
jgi:hypothetical protein